MICGWTDSGFKTISVGASPEALSIREGKQGAIQGSMSKPQNQLQKLNWGYVALVGDKHHPSEKCKAIVKNPKAI